MPTDDVNNADGTPRADDAAAVDPTGAAPFRAMSLDDLDPEPDDGGSQRLTRREARARREARREDPDPALPTSTPVGGATRVPEPAADGHGEEGETRAGSRLWRRAVRRQEPAEELPPTDPDEQWPVDAAELAADDLDDDTRANPILAPSPDQAQEPDQAQDARASDGAVAAADVAAGEASILDGATPGAAAAGAPLSASDAVGAPDLDASAMYEPEPTATISAEPERTVAMDAVEATEIRPQLGIDAEADRDEAAAAAPAGAAALAWVTADDVADADATQRRGSSGADAPPLVPGRRRSPWPVIAPVATAVVLAGAYVVACAAAPLDNVAPTVKKVEIESPTGAEIEPDWPIDGGAAIAAVGHTDEVPESSNEVRSMASVTKLVTVLMVLDQKPLEKGEEGPSYSFTVDDLNAYYGYLYRGESRLEVPVDGSLTEYQMIEGIMMASANNYADKLVTEVFGSVEEFAEQAPAWLEEHGLESMTVVNPSGVDPANAASPADVVRLGGVALENPIIAEIAKKKSTELPGVGTVENSNPLLGDEGVVGIKTGTLLYNYNIVAAKQLEVDGEKVTVIASVMGQPNEEGRDIVARSLLETAADAADDSTVIVPAETKAGSVTTAWGEKADLVASDELSLVLWNGESADITANIDDVLGHSTGDEVGSIAAGGSFADGSVTVSLTDDVSGPDLGWRLTHPLELLGLS